MPIKARSPICITVVTDSTETAEEGEQVAQESCGDIESPHEVHLGDKSAHDELRQRLLR